MAELNTDGNIEVYPGPPGYSVVDAKGDGVNVQFITNEPRTLNPVELPKAKQGKPGPKGDPGQASIRVHEDTGYRVSLWEVATPAEQMVYGDTGVRSVAGGSVRRSGNMVETTVADPSTLPEGFRPAIVGAKGVYLTNDPWPTTLPGTKVTDPVTMRGLQGYDAATANGYPGTAQQWLDDRYRVLQDPAQAKLGQVYTRTETGAGWADLPEQGPQSWEDVTLDKTWTTARTLGNLTQSRMNDGRVDFYGGCSYVGPKAVAGMWAYEGVRVGVLAPGTAPKFNIELVIRTYEGASGGGYPVLARLHISDKGVMQLLAFSDNGKPSSLTVLAGTTYFDVTGLSYAVRPQ